MKEHYRLRLFGQVQGVGFRYFLLKQAERLGVKGWATNLPDGSVYVEVEAETEQLKEFFEQCQRGPALAKVEKFEFKKGKLKHFTNFEIN